MTFSNYFKLSMVDRRFKRRNESILNQQEDRMREVRRVRGPRENSASIYASVLHRVVGSNERMGSSRKRKQK